MSPYTIFQFAWKDGEKHKFALKCHTIQYRWTGPKVNKNWLITYKGLWITQINSATKLVCNNYEMYWKTKNTFQWLTIKKCIEIVHHLQIRTKSYFNYFSVTVICLKSASLLQYSTVYDRLIGRHFVHKGPSIFSPAHKGAVSDYVNKDSKRNNYTATGLFFKTHWYWVSVQGNSLK